MVRSVLLIEDDHAYARLLDRILIADGPFRTTWAPSLTAGLDALERDAFDVVVLDLNLPDSGGTATVARLHEAFPHMPIVVLSGDDDEETVREALRRGAQEYLVKDSAVETLALLPRAIRHAIQRAHEDTCRRAMSEGLRAVVRAADVLVQCPDVDTLCRRAVELARERLGIERCGIFLDAGDCIRGTYGTDRNGNTTDEHGYRDAKGECWETFHTRRARENAWFRIDRAYTEWNGTEPVPFGEGWVVITPILSSNRRAIGVFTNDAAISGAPIDPIAQDILAVYCSHFGSIIERKRAEEELRAERDRAKLYLDVASVIILALDRNGIVTLINRKGCELLGYTCDEIIGKCWFDHFVTPDTHCEIQPVARALLDGTVPFNYNENTVVTRNGKQRLIAWHNVPIVSPDGTVSGHLSSGLDITDQRQAEAQLRQAQKLESLGTMAGGVAHEINNPLMGIMNYAQLIKDTIDGNNATLTEYSNAIIAGTERIAAIVRNLLSFSRQEMLVHGTARLRGIVADTLSLVGAILRRDGIIIEVDVPEDMALAACNAQQIQQVLMNLLTNARDALNERYPWPNPNKKLIIRARELPLPSAAAPDAPTPPTRHVRLTVEDFGTGIPEHVRERMFDPFYTTKPHDRGTGLGLSISHGIVRDHHGALNVETRLGHWTRFHVDLPAGD